MEEDKSVSANSPRSSSGLPHTNNRGNNCFRFCRTIGIGAREGYRDDKHYSNDRRRKPV